MLSITADVVIRSGGSDVAVAQLAKGNEETLLGAAVRAKFLAQLVN